MWWRTWLALDASAAVAFLRDEVSAQKPLNIADAYVCACIVEEELMDPQGLFRDNSADLLALLDVVLRHVRPTEDTDEFRSPRYQAQRFRNAIFDAVVKTGAPEAIRELTRLSTQPWCDEWWRDLLTRYTDDCARHAVTQSCPLENVPAFIDRGALMPQSSADLFRITFDTLLDIKHDIEQGDNSPRAAYCHDDQNELQFQILLSGKLESKANERYNVVREPELADRTRADLRVVHNRLGLINIEIKIAERWTLDDLKNALKDQLVGQYMKDAKARSGVLVLVSARKSTRDPKKWEVDKTQKICFSDLVLHLQDQAKKLRDERAEIEHLEVIGIDFHEPSASAKRPGDSSSSKRSPRSGTKGARQIKKKTTT